MFFLHIGAPLNTEGSTSYIGSIVANAIRQQKKFGEVSKNLPGNIHYASGKEVEETETTQSNGGSEDRKKNTTQTTRTSVERKPTGNNQRITTVTEIRSIETVIMTVPAEGSVGQPAAEALQIDDRRASENAVR